MILAAGFVKGRSYKTQKLSDTAVGNGSEHEFIYFGFGHFGNQKIKTDDPVEPVWFYGSLFGL